MNIIETNLNFKSNMEYGNIPCEIVLHHAEASSCTIYDIHSWHLANGWAGCGYHFLVRKDGSIYTGRPEAAIGAHCPDANSKSIGICAEGNYMTETMPQEQKDALVELGQYIAAKYKINYVYGHKELYNTSCPGTNYPLSELKEQIMGNSSKESSNVSNATSSLVEGDIKTIQALFNSQGFTDETGQPLTVDGVVGKHTEMAASKCVVRSGASGEITTWIQERLLNKGYSLGVLGADGCFGLSTLAAIKKFQIDNGLTADGVIGANTWSALLS